MLETLLNPDITGAPDENTRRKQLVRDLNNSYENVLDDVRNKVIPALQTFVKWVRWTAKQLAKLVKAVGGPDG